MSDWTTIIRTALASMLGALSLAASFCEDSDPPSETQSGSVVARVTDQPARAAVSDEPVQESATPETSGAERLNLPAALSTAIQEVRRFHGSMLEGTALHDPSATEDDFSSALQRVARESETVSPEPIPLEPAYAPVFVPSTEQGEGSVLLRQAARELERRAADSEDLRQFEEADRLRRLCNQLRREARRWDQRAQLTD
jgi:hypothetical protein